MIDQHLTYVAMTRHRDRMICAAREDFGLVPGMGGNGMTMRRRYWELAEISERRKTDCRTMMLTKFCAT